MENNEIIDDSENWASKADEVLGYRGLVMKQLGRVVINSSREMRPGIKIFTQAPNMNPTQINYISDSRKELCQSINCLHDLLMPKFDEDAKTKCKAINEKISGETEEMGTDGPEKENISKKTMWKEKLKNYRDLFQEMCLFLERMGWLESGSVEQ